MSDPIQIDFNEEYRRSKRNVLFWASSTIVLVLGTFTSSVPIETSWAQNIEFSPILLVIGSWLIMLFMAVDLWHSNHRLSINFNPLKATIVEKGTVKQLSEVANQFATIKVSLEPIKKYFQQIATEVQKKDANLPNDEIAVQLTSLSEKVDKVSGIQDRLSGFASAVDNRDIRVRRFYHVGFTIALCIVATFAAGTRVFCSLEFRQEIAALLPVERPEVPLTSTTITTNTPHRSPTPSP